MEPAAREYRVFLFWLILFGLSCFGTFTVWFEGLLRLVVDTDQSKLCLVIFALFGIGTIHCAARSFFISRQTALFRQIVAGLELTEIAIRDNSLCAVGRQALPDSISRRYFDDLLKSGLASHHPGENTASDANNLTDVYIAVIKGPHEFGWFVVDLMVKLGLLGTIVGFILMMGSVMETTSFDVHTMQNVLRKMSGGMATALYTTLAGLTCSILLSLQYHNLDRGADGLLGEMIRIAQTRVLSKAPAPA